MRLDLIDATAFQELVNSAVYSFANLTAIQSNILSNRWTNCIRTDTETYHRYDATNFWVSLLGGADITAVTITTATDLDYLVDQQLF